jgi:hypothetical protein
MASLRLGNGRRIGLFWYSYEISIHVYSDCANYFLLRNGLRQKAPSIVIDPHDPRDLEVITIYPQGNPAKSVHSARFIIVKVEAMDTIAIGGNPPHRMELYRNIRLGQLTFRDGTRTEKFAVENETKLFDRLHSTGAIIKESIEAAPERSVIGRTLSDTDSQRAKVRPNNVQRDRCRSERQYQDGKKYGDTPTPQAPPV